MTAPDRIVQTLIKTLANSGRPHMTKPPRRVEEQDHSAMGETQYHAFCAERLKDGVGLYFRRNLPGRRKRRLPSCNGEAMALHLEEIAIAVAPGAHALVVLDQAGWHVSTRLPIQDNITLLPLRPKSPELNPVENI